MARPLPLALLLAFALPASAQSFPDWASPESPATNATPPTDPGGGPGTPTTPAQEVPLDGGLGLLALAGGAYAARTLRARRPD